jgi:hypothetical protein
MTAPEIESLVWGVVRRHHSDRIGQTRWRAIVQILCVPESTARALCKRYQVDPDGVYCNPSGLVVDPEEVPTMYPL